MDESSEKFRKRGKFGESVKEIASGVYIYLVTDKAGSKPATGKLVIIR